MCFKIVPVLHTGGGKGSQIRVTAKGMKKIQSLFDKQRTVVYANVHNNKQPFALKIPLARGCISYTQNQGGNTNVQPGRI